MIKKIVCIAGFLLSAPVLAHSKVDFYGDDKGHAEQILNKYGNEIEKLESALLKNLTAEQFRKKLSPASEQLFAKRQGLVKEIQKKYGYSFVTFDTIFYSGNIGHYTTIEVVRANQPERMRFVPHPKKEFKGKHKKDVINQMMEYSAKTLAQFATTRKNLMPKICPVFHCVGGFDSAEFKPYLKLFNDGAINQRALILDALKNDPNPERRSAAVFLVGHFKNPQDIVQVLLPYVNDEDSGVRNNAMRVIGMTMLKAKISKIDARIFLEQLNSPFDTDRNKALLVLMAATKSSESRSIMKQIGLEKLLAMLKLKQPNNHDIAYQILKAISGKDFGDTNIGAWGKWAQSVKHLKRKL